MVEEGTMVIDDGDDLVPVRALPTARGTLDERRERRANVHRLFLDYISADNETSSSVTERDENTDKITVIRLHHHMERRVIRYALIKCFMTLSRRQRDVWLAVEFGVVREVGSDGQWSRRFLHPEREGGMTLEEVGEYYGLAVSTIRERHREANQKLVAAATEVRL
jgi:hypothetical protein